MLEALAANLDKLSNYPATRGIETLRQTIADWLVRRFQLLQLDPETQVLPVNGTREALFAFAQAVVSATPGALVLSPNPFYQIYEGAALLAGASPKFLNCTAETGFLPDFETVTEEQWQQCQLLYLCSPGNPTGAILDPESIEEVIGFVRHHSDLDDIDILADRLNTEPAIFRGCSSSELGTMVGVAALIWVR